jgi:hypothetical protein
MLVQAAEMEFDMKSTFRAIEAALTAIKMVAAKTAGVAGCEAESPLCCGFG